jgi:tRNA A22 N-methylase
MTHPEILRKYLLDEGFCIIGEDVVSDMTDERAKVYQIINAVYTGKASEGSSAELLFGKLNLERGGDEVVRLVEREAKKNGEILNSKENAGQDASYEREILGFASEYLERMGQ